MSRKQQAEAIRLADQYSLADLLQRAEGLGYGVEQTVSSKLEVACFIVTREAA